MIVFVIYCVYKDKNIETVPKNIQKWANTYK